MTRRRIRRSADEADVNMTPMLDIVFIMLIFFIVTAVFFDETGIDMTQPQATPPIGPAPKPISVYLYADGSAAINGTRTDVHRIPAQIHSIRAEDPQAVVVLGADKAAPHGNVVILKDKLDRDNIPVNLKVRTQ